MNSTALALWNAALGATETMQTRAADGKEGDFRSVVPVGGGGGGGGGGRSLGNIHYESGNMF